MLLLQVQDTLQAALDELPDYNEDSLDSKSGLKIENLKNGHSNEESFSQAKLGGCCESDLALCQLIDSDASLLGADWFKTSVLLGHVIEDSKGQWKNEEDKSCCVVPISKILKILQLICIHSSLEIQPFCACWRLFL